MVNWEIFFLGGGGLNSKGLMKVQEKKKKCTKKRDARAKLFCCFFCLSEPIAFMPFSLKSPSSLLISFLNASRI